MTKSSTIVYTAALSALLLQLASCSTTTPSSLAFVPSSNRRVHHQQHSQGIPSTTSYTPAASSLSSTAIDLDELSILQSRNRLLSLSKTLSSNSPSGKMLSRPSDKIKLQKAINELEGLLGSRQYEKELLLGDWILIATANLPSSDIRRRFDTNNNNKKSTEKKKKNGWFNSMKNNNSQLNPIQKSLQKSITVTQRIRNDGSNEVAPPSIINRVDNVIEFTPLDTLESILPDNSPLSFLASLNVNPLKVSKGKVVLVHKAEVESVEPVLRTKITWTSSVLNVAGTSRNLDPDGQDVFGINNLAADFIDSAGTFDTPFIDGDVRVSRTSGPVLEQLRVFVRVGSTLLADEASFLETFAVEPRVQEEKEVVVEKHDGELEEELEEVLEEAVEEALEEAFDVIVVADVLDVGLEGKVKEELDIMDVEDVAESDLKEDGESLDEVGDAAKGSTSDEDGEKEDEGAASKE